MPIVNGRLIAEQLIHKLKLKIQKDGLKPHLAVVLVGNDPASLTYVRKKQEAALKIGIKFSLFKFPANIGTENLITELRLIQKQKLSGIIVQLPLPKAINKQKVLNELDPMIDVDYLSWESLGKLVIGENPLIPPTPGAILEVLQYHKMPLLGKHVVM